jgi:hypothetical protein
MSQWTTSANFILGIHPYGSDLLMISKKIGWVDFQSLKPSCSFSSVLEEIVCFKV